MHPLKFFGKLNRKAGSKSQKTPCLPAFCSIYRWKWVQIGGISQFLTDIFASHRQDGRNYLRPPLDVRARALDDGGLPSISSSRHGHQRQVTTSTSQSW